MSPGQKKEVKHIADIVDEWGIWQFQYAMYLFCVDFIGAFVNMGYSFHAKRVDFWCKDVPENTEFRNITKSMQCMKYINPNESCTEWRYNTTQFRNSIITEFDLVCDREYYASLTQSCFQLGYVVSGLVVSYFSDKYGRRPVIWFCYTIDLLAMISCGLSVNIIQYSISRFFAGLGHSGGIRAVYAILIEICGPKHRADIVMLSAIGWIVGYCLLPGLAFWLQDFRLIQLTTALPMFVLLVWFYFLFESPRWQLTNGQLDRAEATLSKALKMNGKTDENLKKHLKILSDHLKTIQDPNKVGKSKTILDLFKTRNLRKNTLIVSYASVVISLLYYGISFNMDLFGGNFYLTFGLSGLVELPTQLLTPIFLRFVGRRKLFFAFMSLIAVSCVAVIPFQSGWPKVVFALLAKYAVSCSVLVMMMINYELYPTVLRSTGIGATSVVGRVGSISAPFMRNLVSTTSLTFVMLFYCALTAVGAFLGLLLPETKDRELPDTIEEAENFKSIELKAVDSK